MFCLYLASSAFRGGGTEKEPGAVATSCGCARVEGRREVRAKSKRERRCAGDIVVVGSGL